jgi:cold-inducible RNA-binding protein
VRNNLYIGNLGPAGGEALARLLSPFGVVRYAAVLPGDGPASGPRFGVVEMQTEDEADAAIEALDGSELDGRVIEVRWATPPEQTACGHPAMFGAMNVSNGAPARRPPQDLSPTGGPGDA